MTCATFIGSMGEKGTRAALRVLETDTRTGAMRLKAVLPVAKASYFALNRKGTRLYVSGDDESIKGFAYTGGVLVYDVKGTELTLKQGYGTGRGAPCHLSLSPSEDALVFADYSMGWTGYVPLGKDGTLEGLCVQVKHKGIPGPDASRQEKAHAHCARVTPDGKYLCGVDLGLDQVKVFDFAHRDEGLSECANRTIQTQPAGYGPRHIVFSKDGRFAFVVFELQNAAASYRYAHGTFTLVNQLSTIPEGFKAFSKASAIVLSEDGTRLFCSNRGHDSIACFDVDAQTGRLTARSIVKLEDAWPWDMAFAPGGKILTVCFAHSDSIATYRYDRDACTLTRAEVMGGLKGPFAVCHGRV